MRDYVIRTSNLKRCYGDVVAVNNINLQVEPGSIYGFLGPNGAGKSTTIRLILGLIKPDAGVIQLFGQSLQHNRISLLKQVGALVESPSLYTNLTARENMEVTRRLVGVKRHRIDELLHVVGLHKAADRLVRDFSTGMKQRLGIALALINRPALLILDEPTNGLDPAGIREMRSFIQGLACENGTTVFLSSHLLNEVEQIATHIGIINQGVLLFQGTQEELHASLNPIVKLGVDKPIQAKQILSKDGWTITSTDGQTLLVTVNGLSDVAIINTKLAHLGINVFQLDLIEYSLEDIFLNLTNSYNPEQLVDRGIGQ